MAGVAIGDARPPQAAGPKKSSVQFTILAEEDLLRPFAPALRS